MTMSLEALMSLYPLAFEFEPTELHDEAMSKSEEATYYDRIASKIWEKMPLGHAREKEALRLSRIGTEAAAAAAEARRMLNAFFLSGGSVVGNEHVVKGHLYRLVTPGNAALHLGPDVPSDDAWSDRDELAERTAEFSQMVQL